MVSLDWILERYITIHGHYPKENKINIPNAILFWITNLTSYLPIYHLLVSPEKALLPSHFPFLMFFIKSEFRWWESKMFHLMMDQRSRLFLLLLFYLLINLVHLGLYQSYFSLRRRRRRSNMRLLKFPIFRLVVTIKLGFLSEELAIAHSETYLDSSVRFSAYYEISWLIKL